MDTKTFNNKGFFGSFLDGVEKTASDYQLALNEHEATLQALQKRYFKAHRLWVTRGQVLQGRISSVERNRLIDKKVVGDVSSKKPVKKAAGVNSSQGNPLVPSLESAQSAAGNRSIVYHLNAPQSIISFLSLISTFNETVLGYQNDYTDRYQSAVSKIKKVSEIIPKGTFDGVWEATKDWVGSEDTAKSHFQNGLEQIAAEIKSVREGLNTVLLCTEEHYQKIEACLTAAENILTAYEVQADLGVRVKNVDIKIKEIERNLNALKSPEENIPSRVSEFCAQQSRLKILNEEYTKLTSEDITFNKAWNDFDQLFAEQFVEISKKAVRGDPFRAAQIYFSDMVGFAFPDSYTAHFSDLKEDLSDNITAASVHISRLEGMASRLHRSTEEKCLLLISEDKKRFELIHKRSRGDSARDSEQNEKLQARKEKLAAELKTILIAIPEEDERHNDFKDYLKNKLKVVEAIFLKKTKYMADENKVSDQKKDAIESAFKDPYYNAIFRAKMIEEFDCYLLKEKNSQLSHHNQQAQETLDEIEKDLKILNRNVVRQNILDSAKVFDNHVDRSLHLLNRALERASKWRFFCKSVVIFFEFLFSDAWLPSFIFQYKQFENRQKALEDNQTSLCAVKNELNALDEKKNELSASEEVSKNCRNLVAHISEKIQSAVEALREHSASSDDKEKNLIDPQLSELGNVDAFVEAAIDGLSKLETLCYEKTDVLESANPVGQNYNPFASVLLKAPTDSCDSLLVKIQEQNRVLST